MSYDSSLRDPVTHEEIEVDEPHFMRGGTYQIGGCQTLWLNITYNYGEYYRREDVLGEKGIRAIYGMTGAESIPILAKAAASNMSCAAQSTETISAPALTGDGWRSWSRTPR